ncbi:MAG: DNA polymerase III subunit epsilon, partial [Flavobacterium sp.]|nr:DNA polymerase III subunit epsilon [Flavobacterium sp.]
QLKGREIDENALILVEKDEVIGYGYTNLSFQESQIAILKSLLTPIEHKELARTIVKNYLKNNTGLKIKRF